MSVYIERHIQTALLSIVLAGGAWLASQMNESLNAVEIIVSETRVSVARQDERLSAAVRQLENNGTIITSMIKLTEDRYPRQAAIQDFQKRDRLIQALEARIDKLESNKD
jgi:hypothetical protein